MSTVEPDQLAGDKTVPALKEWAAVAHALLDGRQTVLLRKGGIHEKRFTVAASRFLVFPTVAHSHAESTRPEHQELLALGRLDVTDDELILRVDLEVVSAIVVVKPERIAALEPFHIWTTESVRQNRIDFRPKHQLTALVVRARALRPEVRVPVLAEYAGCRSWVDLPAPDDRAEAAAVHDDGFLADVARQVRSAVG
ncbi:MAG: DUF1802 family protein [Nakamurella sp.]